MSAEIKELVALLSKLDKTIAVNDEKLKNKVDEADFLKELSKRDTNVYKEIGKVNDRLNSLYLKVAGASGLVVGAIELLT